MPASSTPPPILGFISVLEFESEFFGGLLVVNQSGRPLEFHCTSPVKPTRSQQVLFGSTLASYILADNIAPALIRSIKNPPRLFCTDCAELTDVNSDIANVVYIESPEKKTDDSTQHETLSMLKPSNQSGERSAKNSHLLSWDISGQLVRSSEVLRNSMKEMTEILEQFVKQLDLSEPFDRIHNAIRESHGIRTTNLNEAA